MEMRDIIVLVAVLLAVGALISVGKFIAQEKENKNSTYATIFIEMINSLMYKKQVLNNDYPEYPGELEKRDTEEFIEYLSCGILQIIGNKEI